MYRLLILFMIFIFNQVEASRIIGIAGGTCSGKTTLAKKIWETFPENAVLISQDSYYKDISHLSFEERAKVNFDHPNSLDFSLFAEHIMALKEGKSIEKPIYNFHTHAREKIRETILSNQLIIVEGILLFAVPEVKHLFDIKIFIDTDDDIRLLRRIERDIAERSRSFESIRDQYLTTVKPMHDLFVLPSKRDADLIVPFGGENHKALELIISKLKTDLYRSEFKN